MRPQRCGHGLEVGEVVAGVEDQVRLQRRPGARTHSILRVWRGSRCRSERCSTRIGAAPGGSTGTLNRRSVNALRSISEA